MTFHKPPLRRSDRQSGQEAVEFAILLPVLILIVFGVLDLGRAFHAAIVITNAARVGARYAMEYPSDTAGIKAATQSEAEGSGIDLTDLIVPTDPVISTIEVTCPDTCGKGRAIRVTIAYTFTLIMGIVFPDPDIIISRSAEMMVP